MNPEPLRPTADPPTRSELPPDDRAPELIASELRYRRLFESAKDGILILDAETGMIVDVNPFLVRLLSIPHGAFLGKQLWELGFFKDIVANQAHFAELQRKEYIRYEDLPLEAADGRRIQVEFVSNVYQVNHHKVIQCNIRDNTAHNRTAKALRESELKHRTLFETANDAILLMRRDRFVDCNVRTLTMFGCSREQIVGAPPYKFSPPTQPDGRRSEQKALEKINQALAEGPQFFEWEHCRADGTPFTAEVSLNRLELGVEVLLQAIVRDVTLRKRAEEAIRQSEERFRLIMESLTDLVAVLDVDGRRLYNSSSYRNILGDPDSLRGSSSFEEIHPDDRERVRTAFRETVRTGVGQRLEYRLVDRAGQARQIESQGSVIRDDQGRVSKVLVVSRDVTERKRAAEAVQASEARLQLQFDRMPVACITASVDLQITAWNPAAERMFGYAAKEILGKHLCTLVPKEMHPQVDSIFQRLLEGEATAHSVNENLTKDGRTILCDWANTPLRATDGTVIGMLCMAQDITERKRTEEAVRDSEKRFRSLAEAISQIIWFTDGHGQVCGPMPSWQAYTGQTDEEIRGSGWNHALHPDDLPRTIATWTNAVAGKTGYETEYRVRRHDGDYRHFAVRGAPVLAADGSIREWVGTCSDITERKQAERALAQERNLLRTLIDNLPDYIFVKDAQSRFVLNNRAHLALLRATTQEEVVGKTDGDIFPPEIAARYYADEQTLLRSGEPLVNREESTVDPAGRVRWLLTTKVPLRDEQGKITGLVGVSRDITERKRAEETLRQSEEKSRILFEQAGDIILQLEMMPDGRPVIRDANSVTFRLLGFEREELIGQPVSFIEALPDAAKVVEERRRNVLSGVGNIFVARHRCKDGTIRDFECSVTEMQIGSKTLAISVERDITERKQIERQLQRTQRLESIGTLAGGIAHDLNNALAPIMMATELLRLEFPDMADRYLDIIRSSTKRGADLVKQLLTFAKGAEGERLLVQPKHLLKEMVKPISSTFPKNIELRTQHAKDLWTILGDATQLHQVLLNLCVNARDAMPEGGTLTLEAENQELDAAYASTVPEAKPGRHVVWRVTDTGTGIPPEVLDRIFDPFFTTKGPDKGTGLGLSTTLGIVKSHGGFIRVYSTPGQGSTFAVYLPAYGVGAKDIALLTKAETDFRGKGETILVVDDEAAVRDMLRTVLTKWNFKVLTAGDGAAALLQVAEPQTELRVVITDLHMPHMDGLSFVRVLKARRPQAGIIVVSGRLDERAADEFKKLGVTALLEKPFTHEKLVEALKTVFQK